MPWPSAYTFAWPKAVMCCSTAPGMSPSAVIDRRGLVAVARDVLIALPDGEGSAVITHVDLLEYLSADDRDAAVLELLDQLTKNWHDRWILVDQIFEASLPLCR